MVRPNVIAAAQRWRADLSEAFVSASSHAQ
jgi:hypothetical protein